MSLPALKWKMLTDGYNLSTNETSLRILYNIFTSSVYNDGTPRITGSVSGSTGWTFYISGSPITSPHVIYGYPPTITAASQSVIFAAGSPGTLPSGSIRILNTIYGGTTGYNSGNFLAGISINSGVYKNFALNPPMETGSALLGNTSSFFGYSMLSLGGLGATYAKIYESNECLLFLFMDGSKNTKGALLVGAIIDPETTNYGEIDGRIYGMSTTEARPLAKNWISSASNVEVTAGSNRFLTSNLGNLLHKTAYFLPGSTYVGSSSLAIHVSDTAMSNSFTTNAEELPRLPIFVKDYFTGRFVGRYREIQIIRNSTSGTTFYNGSTVLGYAIGQSTVSASNCVFLPRI